MSTTPGGSESSSPKAVSTIFSVSKGGRFEDAKQPKIGEAVYPYTGESGYECMPTVLSDARGPFGRNVPLAAAIRRALRDAGHATPVVTSGGITTFEQAEGILERGEADCVAAARQYGEARARRQAPACAAVVDAAENRCAVGDDEHGAGRP